MITQRQLRQMGDLSQQQIEKFTTRQLFDMLKGEFVIPSDKKLLQNELDRRKEIYRKAGMNFNEIQWR